MALAYYMFVNHGIFPGAIAELSPREQELCWQMAKKEMEARKKVRG